MKSFQIAVDPADGTCVITFGFEDSHLCMNLDGVEFDAIAEIVAKAQLDSKFARS